MVRNFLSIVNRANCLINNLSEMDSSPHVRNLSEIPRPGERAGTSGSDHRKLLIL